MGTFIELKNLIQDAINKGANDVEKIHKYIAGLPFETLIKIDAFKETFQKTQEFQEITIGTMYDLIRQLNQKVGDLAGDLLNKADSATDTSKKK